MPRGNTHSGIIRRAPGRKTRACASITCCYRRRPATVSSTPGSTATYAPGKSPLITFRSGLISILRRRSPPPILRRIRAGESVLAALYPVLEHLQRHRAVVVGRLGERLVVAVLDPNLIRRGAGKRQRQPHQAAGGLARQLVAVEQHLTEQGLRLVLALLRGKAQPARPVAEVVARAAR